MARLRSKSLNQYLRSTLGAAAGSPGSFLSEPYVEGAFPWMPASGGWDGLPPGLLHPKTIETLRVVSPAPPYRHQVEAWKILCSEEPSSLIVSSGTGSGKTECFLTPILDRLVRLSDGGVTKPSGVRALMLYPLNALISSQEERLSRWFSPFNGKLRYCLYNGETPEEVQSSSARNTPWRVGDRSTLRREAPPVLVTNITMLEYMLIRQKDARILEASQGTLEFIILDEAHSYVGAQAAELSLLLRRVALAFGRKPEEVRYIATSATIGGEDGGELRRFLRDLSGAPEDRVHLIRGERAPLPHPSSVDDILIRYDDVKGTSPLAIGERLGRSRSLRAVRERLRSGETVSWSAWCETSLTISPDAPSPTALLMAAASARDPNADATLAKFGGDSILPSRIHLFQRTLTGLWACLDATCPGRPDLSAESDWAFGAVYLEPRTHCSHCRGLVLEWAFCGQCGDGALKGELSPEGDALVRWESSWDAGDYEQTLDPVETFEP